MAGFIFLYRDLTEWEWYQNQEVFRLFIHLLIKSNYCDKKWQGITVKRGQLITSTNHLAAELKMSVQKVRTALIKLQSSGYITRQTTNRFTIITVVNYGARQSIGDTFNKQNAPQTTSNQLSNSKQLTTTKESNNKKNRKNIKTEVRKENFKKQVFEHSQYSNKTLSDFFNYWSELNLNKTQMRFEVEKFFELEKRLKKWAQNERIPNVQKGLEKKLITNR